MNLCQKFNVNNLKWESMPNLIHARFAPGIFITKSEKMYSFGGQHDSIERIDLQSEQEWEIVDIDLPMDLGLGL